MDEFKRSGKKLFAKNENEKLQSLLAVVFEDPFN